MTTFIVDENSIDAYGRMLISTEPQSVEECKLNIVLSSLGYKEIELNEARIIANVGDCLLLEYSNILMPFQIIEKIQTDDSHVPKLTLQSYYGLEQIHFDLKTNDWKTSRLRKYLNTEFLSKLGKEVAEAIIPTDVSTDDYVTKDKVYVLSHEEMGIIDSKNEFVSNLNAHAFSYYKTAN